MSEPKSKASHFERTFFLFGLLAFLSCLAYEVLVLHPNFTPGDEADNIQKLQFFLEGGSLPWRLGAGCLHRGLLLLVVKLLGPSLASLRSANLLIALLEALALFAWLYLEGGERLAIWGTLFNLACAATMLRLRCLLSFSLFPFEFSALLAWLAWKRSNLAGFFWAFCSALCLLDYELWLLALPVLFGFYLLHPVKERFPWPSVFAGLILGLGLVLWLSRDSFATYAAVRSRQLPLNFFSVLFNFRSGLQAYFGGANSVFISAFPRHPTFPLWAWPALLVGLILALKYKKSILFAILLALLPLGSYTETFEPHRLELAWPFLCLLTGMGCLWLAGKIENKVLMPSSILLAILMAFGGWAEGASYSRNMAATYDKNYGGSASWIDAANYLRRPELRNANLLTELDSHPKWILNFLAGRRRAPWNPAKPTVAWIPWAYVPNPDPAWGKWINFQHPGHAPTYLLFPTPSLLQRLRALDQQLSELWFSLPEADYFLRRQKMLSVLSTLKPASDPWLKTAYWEAAGPLGYNTLDFDEGFLQQAFRQPLLSATLFVVVAYHIQDLNPSASLLLLRQALRLDSHRQQAWDLSIVLLEKLGQAQQAAGLRAKLQALPAAWTWNEVE